MDVEDFEFKVKDIRMHDEYPDLLVATVVISENEFEFQEYFDIEKISDNMLDDASYFIYFEQTDLFLELRKIASKKVEQNLNDLDGSTIAWEINSYIEEMYNEILAEIEDSNITKLLYEASINRRRV